MPLGTGVGLGSGHTVLDWDPALPAPKRAHPQFLGAHVCYGKTAGWIMMPHGTEIGLGPGNIVLDGDRAPLTRDAEPPISIPCLFSLNGWTDQDTT